MPQVHFAIPLLLGPWHRALTLPGLFRLLVLGLPWLVSCAWLLRTLEALAYSHRIPDLVRLPEPAPFAPSTEPLLSVIVPACNEEAAIAATIHSLLASRGVPLQIIAVNDRSTDQTGSILDSIVDSIAATRAAPRAHSPDAEQSAADVGPHTFEVLHIYTLPEGWLGKPHALAQGFARARAPLLLFTDADILYRADALLRCVAFFQQQQLDHLAFAATPVSETVGERMVIGALQAIGVWSLRLWKISDPRAKDSVGVGSFTLVRREAYLQVGGWDRLRLEVLEDLRFGWEIKRRHHLHQQFATGRDLLRLRWAVGALGLANNLTKNGFALFRYRLVPALLAVVSLCVMVFAPIAALFGPPATRWSFAPFALALLLLYRRDLGKTGNSVGYALLFPFGALVFVYAILRSICLTLVRGGVEWRGTLYPLATLRREAGPLR
ncbi:glycosyltransferase family 2 protein [Acidipila sp. EB88]|uniref:glycosyltransferase n=1 Tax=Acidipila sp. EB88 TaxID=2305226 RepID=UPI0013155488|nr:glycosyltransferase family 2 protein [Acidipila sp. EB88]